MQTSPRRVEPHLDAGLRDADAARLAEQVGVAELHARARPRSSRRTRASTVWGSASLIARKQLGRRRRRAGVGLDAGSRGRSRRRRARGCAPTPPGCSTAATRGGARSVRSRVSASGLRTKCTGRRPCQAPSAIVQPAMWNSGNMHTVPGAARGRRRADVRAQPVRAVRQHDALRPPGAPAREEDDVRIALVEVGRSGASAAPSRESRAQNGMSTRAASSAADVGVRRAAQQEPRPRVLGDGPTSSTRRPRVQRREHRADLRERREHGDRLERGVAPPQHAVAAADPELAQPVRDPVRLRRRSRRTSARRRRASPRPRRARRGPRSRASRAMWSTPQHRTPARTPRPAWLVDNDC